ncbi:MAG TPA: glucosaminidase domain-containing protein [Verrucomicrobiae bacterium]|nr:glucosaminidase domain-containing protein [Verrucomicrobiae bacterium]
MSNIKKVSIISIGILALSATLWAVVTKADIAWLKPKPSVEQAKIILAGGAMDPEAQTRITDMEQDRSIRIRQGLDDIKAVNKEAVPENLESSSPVRVAQIQTTRPVATRSAAKPDVKKVNSNPSPPTSSIVAPQPPSQPIDQKTAIMGKSTASANQLEKLIHLRNPAAPYLSSIYFRMEGIYHIRADIAFLQMVKETNALKFTGEVSISQHNPAGIGATGGVAGATFPSWDVGIEAQFQHLLAYASTSPIPAGRELVDPRFSLVQRGTAPYVEWLGKADNPNGVGWAWPGDGYGYSIINLLNEALKY